MKQSVCRLGVLLLALLCTPGARSQRRKTAHIPSPQSVAGESKVSETPHEMTATDVQTFLDGFMPMQLERENIAGAVVLVVKDDKVLFAKGYGYSDMEKKTPVSVDGTLFRPGSISKLFTWTAVMQQVEQGKLDLDHDVNEYLDFKIPAKFSKPITLRNLMTHTPGFEEQVKDLINEEGVQVANLHDHLAHYIPERIFPPGTTPAYSNYGAALAGYIVERVSGQPFDDYVAANIFKQLGMTRSSFAQSLPSELKALMSKGYTVGSGKPKPFEVIEESPTGGLSSTAADLARFMIAHLQDGKFESVQILGTDTARLMHSRQFGLVPAMNGMCLGFYEESRNGHRIIGHGGDTIYFHSDLHLVLDSGVGFFVSYNSGGKHEISPRTALWEHFLDRYFPYTVPDVQKLASAQADAHSVAGPYLTSRRSEGSFLKVAAVDDNVEVTPDADGTIKVEPFKDFSGEIKKWREIAPLVYRAVDGQDLLAFRRDEHGQMQLIPNFPAAVYQRVSLFASSDFNQTLILGLLTIMALTLLFWPAAAAVRSHYHQRLDLDPRHKRLRFWVRVVCAVDIFFLVTFYLVLTHEGAGTFSPKLDLKLQAIQCVGVAGVLGTVLVLLACLRSWKDNNFGWWAKVWNLFVLLACLAFVWFSFHWNLLNFNMNY